VSEQTPDILSADLGAGSTFAAATPSVAPVAGPRGTGEAKPKPFNPEEAPPHVADPVGAEASAHVESPRLAPEQGSAADAVKPTPKVEASKPETSKPEAPKVEAPKVKAPHVEVPKFEASRVGTGKIDDVQTGAKPATGKVMIMSPSRDGSRGGAYASAAEPHAAASGMFGKRRLAALAAVIALAAVTGAIGGALASGGFAHASATASGNEEASTALLQNQNRALEESITRIENELAAVKKANVALTGKFNERFDKIEKAQAEPAAKLAKLSEAVDKLHATPPAAAAIPAPAPVASNAAPKEITGSIQPPATTQAPKPEIARLPTVEGWVLRDVGNGGALIEGRQGMFEVFAGDPIPGLGRVDAIRRQDGRWVVVTNKGLIVAR
jgi:hypothetical protein